MDAGAVTGVRCSFWLLVQKPFERQAMQMSPKSQTYIIDFTGKTKEAALYFDWVVPLSYGSGTTVRFQTPESHFIQRISPESLYTSSQSPQPCRDYLQAIDALHSAAYFPLAKYPEDECRKYYNEFAEKAIRMIAARPELHGAPFLLPEGDPSPGLDTVAEFLVTLTDLSLVDAERASWDQILEFRKDEKSRMALRRLQVFAIKEYSGKDKAFIEEDILLRIEAYNNVVRDWGFETRAAALSNLLNSKVLLGGFGGAVLSSLFGTQWVAAVSATTGITVELGNIAIDLAKRHYSLATLRRDHPLSFIITARAQLASKGSGPST
jgi:uncharacterized membrane protein